MSWKWTDATRTVAISARPILDKQGNVIGQLLRSATIADPELAAAIAGGDVPADPDPPVVLTPKDLAQALMNDTSPMGAFARGLVGVLATRFSLTPAQVVTAIANAAS